MPRRPTGGCRELSPPPPKKRRIKKQRLLISLCQNICNRGIPAGERGIGSPTKEPSSLSNKLVQRVSTAEELKSPPGHRISRYCSLNPRDLAGNVQLSQPLLIRFVAVPLMCERPGRRRSLAASSSCSSPPENSLFHHKHWGGLVCVCTPHPTRTYFFSSFFLYFLFHKASFIKDPIMQIRCWRGSRICTIMVYSNRSTQYTASGARFTSATELERLRPLVKTS